VPASVAQSIEPDSNPKPPLDVPPVVVPLRPATSGLTDLIGVLREVTLGLPDSRGPGRDKGVGGGEGPGIGPGDGPGSGGLGRDGSGDGPGGGGGVMPPQLVTQVRPQYTAQAMAAKAQGMVTLEALVLTDGSVGDVRIVRSLDPVFGLDQEAIRAVKQWRFAPGTRRGQPIPVLVTIELTFTLR
jgi:protein TonB